MRAAIGLVSGVVMLASASAAPLPEGDGESGLCDGIAAYVRAHPRPIPAETFDDPFDGAMPWATPAQAGSRFAKLLDPGDPEVFAKAFIRAYHPDNALEAAARDFYVSNFEETSLGRIVVLAATEGSAACQTFLMFEMVKGATKALPDLPPGSSSFCGDAGRLVAIHGKPAFLSISTDISNFHNTLGIAMLRPDHWAPACRIQLSFAHTYSISETSIAPGSAVSRAELEAQVLRRAQVNVSGRLYPLIQPPPDKKDTLARMTGLALTSEASRGDHGPLMLGGELYWGMMEVDGIGWRPSPDRRFTLFALAGDALKPVATVKLAGSRGKLQGIQVFRGVW